MILAPQTFSTISTITYNDSRWVVHFFLYTVPGDVFYKSTRRVVLQGVDGVVFVPLSYSYHGLTASGFSARDLTIPDIREINCESLKELHENLHSYGWKVQQVPFLFQWNIHASNVAISVEHLESDLNGWRLPTITADVVDGSGVLETLETIISLVVKSFEKDYGQVAI